MDLQKLGQVPLNRLVTQAVPAPHTRVKENKQEHKFGVCDERNGLDFKRSAIQKKIQNRNVPRNKIIRPTQVSAPLAKDILGGVSMVLIGLS